MFRKILLLALGLSFGIDARAQSPDFQWFTHVFPQFVDGAMPDNRLYVSTFQISATGLTYPTRCNLGLQNMAPTTLVDVRGVRETGTLFSFVLAPNGWQILQSLGTGPLKSGGAVLQCDSTVTAHLIYTLRNGRGVSAEATVSAAPQGRTVQILADQRNDSRVGLAIMNPFLTTGFYRLSVFDVDGRILTSYLFQIFPGQTFTRFVDEIANVPRDFRGPVVIESTIGADVYASGLRFSADAFTAIPAMVRVR